MGLIGCPEKRLSSQKSGAQPTVQHKPEIWHVLWQLAGLVDNSGERLVFFDSIHNGMEYNKKTKILHLA